MALYEEVEYEREKTCPRPQTERKTEDTRKEQLPTPHPSELIQRPAPVQTPLFASAYMSINPHPFLGVGAKS
jgi:hypothetical protein